MKSIRSERGQVAIFVALIFQVLFVFFAMLVNVGLLVHHKINLQNATDMAAYYGAMRQAETLNAMAHVNYQIRQSWKLFAWRYRVLGSLGHQWVGDSGSPPEVNGAGIHPLIWDKNAANPANVHPGRSNESTSGAPVTDLGHSDKWYLRPIFCVANPVFSDWPSNENLCKMNNTNIDGGNFGVPRINNVPTVSGSILGAGATGNVNTFINMSNAANTANCLDAKYSNYYALALFTYGFQIDVAIRKATLRSLWALLRNTGEYNGSRIATGSGPTASSTLNGGNSQSSFFDLNGEDVASGALETLRRNLTEPNRVFLDRQSNFGVNMFNGVTGSGCRFEDAFSENTITPHLFYESSECSAGSGSQFFSQHLSYNPAVPKNLGGAPEPACGSDYTAPQPSVVGRACQLSPYMYNSAPQIRMSLGFSRNPKCVPYFAVRAKTKPNIPFMPGGGVELFAESFAQAFGGSMGPWWGPQYNSTNQFSMTDQRAPEIDVSGAGGAINFTAATEAANYSKYPGDPVGLRSDAQLNFYGYEIINNLVKVLHNIKVNDWSPILLNKEFLSQNPVLKKYEIMALAPDLYDAAYYSIDPDFYRNYFSKMISPNVLGASVSVNLGAGSLNYAIRPDLGSDLDGSGKYVEFSVKDQLATAEQIINNSSAFPGNNRVKLAGSLASQANVLTSWNVFKIGDYDIDTAPGSDMWNQKFGKCIQDVGGTPVTNSYKTIPNTVGNCLSGGRTGFSVRLVSKKYMSTGLGPNIANWPPP